MTDTGASQFTRALVLNRDLMFGSRIRSALGVLGLEARFLPDTARFVAALDDADDSTAIAILDMNGSVDWQAIAAALSAMADAPPTLAFGSHVDAENRRAAKRAGITRIVSNGQFHEGAVHLIDRYRRR